MSLIRAVSTVIDGVAELMAVDAAVVVTSETERWLTFNVHCKENKDARLRDLTDNTDACVFVCTFKWTNIAIHLLL